MAKAKINYYDMKKVCQQILQMMRSLRQGASKQYLQ